MRASLIREATLSPNRDVELKRLQEEASAKGVEDTLLKSWRESNPESRKFFGRIRLRNKTLLDEAMNGASSGNLTNEEIRSKLAQAQILQLLIDKDYENWPD